MKVDDLAELVALTEVDGIGDKRAAKLFRAFESGEDLRTSPLECFDGFHFVDAVTHDQIRELKPVVENHRERFRQLVDTSIEVIGIYDERYPSDLRELHAPLVLYAKGNIDRLEDKTISVSGSRKTNATGQEWIKEIAINLADAGYTIVSGGARGTDTAAHRGSLEASGATIVVLGTGVNISYPKENEDLFAEIVDAGGLLLSHRPPDAGPDRHAFLDRNQTISALSPGIIIVAADRSGGTIAQYEKAIDQGRQVFVPPREREIQPSSGLNDLRSSDQTIIVTSAEDVGDKLSKTVSSKSTGTNCKQISSQQKDQSTLEDWG